MPKIIPTAPVRTIIPSRQPSMPPLRHTPGPGVGPAGVPPAPMPPANPTLPVRPGPQGHGPIPARRC